MNPQLIETGKIVNTHGIQGRVRVEPWADSPAVLVNVEQIYIDEAPIKVLQAEVHKNCVLMNLEGVDSIDGAQKLKNKTVCVDRKDIKLEEDTYFIKDLEGMKAIDAQTGGAIGIIKEVLTLPANNVYVVEGSREILIPAVPEFIEETKIEKGYIKFKMIEGL